jgi:hypothetical protein
LLVQHFTGDLSLPEVLAHYDRVLCHPTLPAISHELTDLRSISALEFGGRPMAGLVAMLSAEYVRRERSFQRGAVLVGAGPSEFAARLFMDALPATVQPRYAIVRDTAAALAWLDLGTKRARRLGAPHYDRPVVPFNRPLR